MSSDGGHEKATFTNLDDQVTLRVQFNPAELHLSDGARWRPRGNVDRPVLTYETGEPATLRLELHVDGTRGGEDVEALHVGPLRALLEQRPRSSTEGREVARPPHLVFTWGTFRFYCVLAQLDVRYVLFRPDGAPVRARVSLTLTEHREPAGPEPIPSPRQGEAARTVTLGPGQTLSDVARRCGCSLGDLARANHVVDPLEVPPGTRLLVPSGPADADALARSRRGPAAAWREDGAEPGDEPARALGLSEP